jgi:hypothetical protein
LEYTGALIMTEEHIVFKGDNTAAFGNNFITIMVKNPLLYPISKLLFVINGGDAIDPKEFTDEDNFQREEIILKVNLDSDETKKLKDKNTGNLIAYDMQGQQATCVQTLIFNAKNGVIYKNGKSCC